MRRSTIILLPNRCALIVSAIFFITLIGSASQLQAQEPSEIRPATSIARQFGQLVYHVASFFWPKNGFQFWGDGAKLASQFTTLEDYSGHTYPVTSVTSLGPNRSLFDLLNIDISDRVSKVSPDILRDHLVTYARNVDDLWERGYPIPSNVRRDRQIAIQATGSGGFSVDQWLAVFKDPGSCLIMPGYFQWIANVSNLDIHVVTYDEATFHPFPKPVRFSSDQIDRRTVVIADLGQGDLARLDLGTESLKLVIQNFSEWRDD